MLSDISIKINGLSDETSLKVVDALRDILNDFGFLDLRRFSNIVITSNFERDVETLSSDNKSSFINRFRANSDTYAIVLNIPKNDDFEQILIVRSEFIKNITKSHKNQEYKNALHILNHELAHIHDNNKKIDVFKELMKTKKYRGSDSILYPISETLWSEYIANFISSQSALDTQYPKAVAKSLVEKIEKTSFDVKTSLLAYKVNRSREDLIEYSILQIESLLKSAAYLIGYLNGMKITLAELDDDLDYRLEVSYFKDIWEVLKHEFATIHQVYPYGFINLSIYKNLSFYVESFYNQMGIVFDEDEKGRVKIHIM